MVAELFGLIGLYALIGFGLTGLDRLVDGVGLTGWGWGD